MGKDGHEELLGTPLEPGSHRQTVEDNLLGRPRVAEKSFAPDAKKGKPGVKDARRAFRRAAAPDVDVPLRGGRSPCWPRRSRSRARRMPASAAKAASHLSRIPWRWLLSWPICAWMWRRCPQLCCTTPSRIQRSRRELVEQEFSPEIAQLVEGVTKITRIEVESLSDEQAATIRKMLVAMSKDIRVTRHQIGRPVA